MKAPKTWKRLLGEWIIAAGVITNSGCLCFHEPQACCGELAHPCHEVARACRCHVYVFMINGLDPCECGTVRCYADWLHSLGFNQTYTGQCYHACSFESEMRKIHKEDHDARFVLIGFSLGAKTVSEMAKAVKDDGIHIDLLAYVDSKCHDCQNWQPDNVTKVVSIKGETCLCDGIAVEIQEVDRGDGTVADALQKQVLSREMALVAVQVPYIERAPAVQPVREEDAPPLPRQVVEQTTTERDEWDFLKPVTRLTGKDAPAEKVEKPVEQKLGAE